MAVFHKTAVKTFFVLFAFITSAGRANHKSGENGLHGQDLTNRYQMDEGRNFKTGGLDLHRGELQAEVLPADVIHRCASADISARRLNMFFLIK